MSIWNKVLVGFIAVASIGFFYMAARTVKVRKHWALKAIAFEQKIKEVQADCRDLKEGKPDDPGIRQLRLDVHRMVVERGRVWRGCAARVANPQTGQVQVTIAEPQPHGIADKTVLFAFQEEPVEKKGSYLGEFKAVAVDEAKKLVALEPTMKLGPRELDRLARSKGPWVLYEKMPPDDHEALAGLKTEELKAMLPEASLLEYARDGQAADANDPPERRVKVGDKEKFVRKLRDYRVSLRNLFAERVAMVDLWESATNDLKSMEAAGTDAQRQEAYCRAEIAAMKKELRQFRDEQDAVTAHQKKVKQLLQEVKLGIEERIASNRAMAEELARIQHAAAQRIDQRTGTMARVTPAGFNN